MIRMAAKLMLFERMQRGKRGLVARQGRGKQGKKNSKEKAGPRRSLRSGFIWGTVLLLAGVGENILRANHTAMQRSRDEGFAFDFAALGIGDSDVVDVQGAAQSAFIVGFSLFEIGEGANLGRLCGDQVALCEDDVVH